MGGDAGVAFFAGLVEGLGEEEAGGGVGGKVESQFFVFEVFICEGEFDFWRLSRSSICWASFLFLDFFELFLVVEVLHLVEVVFGLLEAAESPVEGDDAVGLGEFEEVLGAEGFEKAVAVGDEDEVRIRLFGGGRRSRGRGWRRFGRCGLCLLWFWGRWISWAFWRLARETLVAEGEDGGHENFPFWGKLFVEMASFPPGRRYRWVRFAPGELV